MSSRRTPSARIAPIAALFVPATLAALLALGILASLAFAAKGGNANGGNGKGGGPTGSSSSSALKLVSEYVYNSSNPAAPTSCLNEDDIDQRAFAGSLNGSYSTTYELCDTWSGGVYWGAGGEGMETDIASTGPINDLVITSPTGDAHHAVLMGTSTSNGVTTYRYAACYVPPFSLSTSTGTDPLTSGTWTIALSGSFASATWNTTVRMAYPSFQQTYCPSSEQNLTP